MDISKCEVGDARGCPEWSAVTWTPFAMAANLVNGLGNAADDAWHGRATPEQCVDLTMVAIPGVPKVAKGASELRLMAPRLDLRLFEPIPNSGVRAPVEDFARPVYETGHPGKPVVDHVRARSLGGDPVDPANLDIKPWEMNSRKGAVEGQLLNARKKLMEDLGTDPRFQNFFLRKMAVDFVLAGELDWIMNDVHVRPTPPSTLKRIPAPGSPLE
jgi:hypothetical protein